MKEHQ
jgi:hypothetical protein